MTKRRNKSRRRTPPRSSAAPNRSQAPWRAGPISKRKSKILTSTMWKTHYKTPEAPIRTLYTRSRVLRPSVVVTTKLHSKPLAVRKPGSYLRLSVHPKICTRRKQFKSTMMKKLAAQAKAGGNLNKWRRTLGRRPITENRC